MNKLLVFLRRHRVLIFGVLVCFLLLLGIVMRLLTPRFQPTADLTNQGNPDGSHTQFGNLVIEAKQPILPAELWIGTLEKQQKLNTDQLVQDIITSYRLVQSPYLETAWFNNEFSLDYDPSINQINFARNLLTQASPDEVLNPNSEQFLIGKTEAIIKTTFPELEFQSLPGHAEYLRGSSEFETTTLDQATHLSVPFSATYGGIPIKLGVAEQFPVIITVDSKGELTTMTVRPYDIQMTPTIKRPIKNLNEALNAIEAGNASVINSFSAETFTPSLTQIRRGTITNAVVEYRTDEVNKTVIPYYRFSGEFVNEYDDLFTADIITPAVSL